MIKELTIAHLAPYLPYGLKINSIYGVNVPEGGSNYIMIGCSNKWSGLSTIKDDLMIEVKEKPKKEMSYIYHSFKPLLFPLSSLTKEITVNGETFVPAYKLSTILITINGDSGNIKYLGVVYNAPRFDFYGEQVAILGMPYHIIETLFEWKIDVFGLIESGLAIDVTTLETNPYDK